VSPGPLEPVEVLPALLYVLFTLLSAVGAFWIGAHFRNRRVGAVAAAAVLFFFLALGLFLAWLPGYLGAPVNGS
jgi:hypothetical protein